MRTIRTNSKKVAKKIKKFDWSRIDAMTNKDIVRQIASNPDAAAAPDMSAALKRGEFKRPIKPGAD